MKLHRDVKTRLIRQVPLFADCPPRHVAEIAAIADEVDLKQGTHLTEQDAEGREFVIILEGQAEVLRAGAHVADLGPGDWLGEVALLTGQPRNATVEAKTPVRALVIEHHQFHHLLDHAPQLRAKLEEHLLRHTA